ncbi:ABC1 family-domain-containing protein [Cladochytrium replicatum]|nr:ABC1 family-domain-containing protein [Cladochytrium replicatum]
MPHSALRHLGVSAIPARSARTWSAPFLHRRTSTSDPPPLRRRFKPLRFVSLIAGAGLLAYAVYDPAETYKQYLAVVRSSRTVVACVLMGVDYKWSLRNGPEVLGEEGYEQVKSDCHQRSANRLLDLTKANAGIYIKLGQHIAALVYVLPEEYTSTMRVLQDRAKQSSLQEIESLFKTDMGVDAINDMFSEFDPNPIGVASLAQVHRATLRATGQEVAVKIQHPSLETFTPIDIRTVTFAVRAIKWFFPEFEFTWLADELQQSLPKEMDFEQEAANAKRVANNYKYRNPVLKIPDIIFSRRRVLVMEYIKGAGKVDDRSFMEQNGIDCRQVSAELTKVYSEMIFLDGFVHCDPHPGNVFVRPKPGPSLLRRLISVLVPLVPVDTNFEIVLLDHGLYRSLTDEFRLDYAHLWENLINGNEAGIEHYAYRLFTHDDGRGQAPADGIHHHRLFASMMTGRPWNVISSENSIAAVKTQTEFNEVQRSVSTGRFLVAIADILAKLPRELLLLLKTNDLLRAVDDQLGVTKGDASHMLRMAVCVQGLYCAKAIRRQELRQLREADGIAAWNILPLLLKPEWWQIFGAYVRVVVRALLVSIYLDIANLAPSS